MKTSLLMLLCAGCASHAPLPQAARQPAARTQAVSDRAAIINPPPTVTVSWAYPLEWETPDLIFKLYHSDSLAEPIPRWPLLKSIKGSQRSTQVECTQPREFFVLTASNYLGESSYGTP